MIREHAQRLLHDVHSVLTELNLTHFLIDGTLLGAVREGDFIGHDLDIDFGVYAEEWTPDTVKAVEEAMQKRGIRIGHKFGDFETCYEIALQRELKCDLFFYRKDGEHRIFHAFKNGGKNLAEDTITYEYRAELIENLKPMIFQNEYYPAPADPIAVLVSKYGPEWRVPIKKWDWQYGPRNVRK